MSPALLTLVLVAVPERLDALARLAAAPPATRLEPVVKKPAPKGRTCHFSRWRFDDTRIPLMWAADCFSARSWKLVVERGVAVVPLQSLQSMAAFDATRAEELDRWGAGADWVPPRAFEAAKKDPSGVVELGVDPRDGSIVAQSYERGYVRIRNDARGAPAFEPLFEGALPQEARTPKLAVVFDADRSVKAPWLVYAPDPWRNGELRVRAPSGAEDVLLRLPRRSTGGDYRVDTVQALRLTTQRRPIVSAIVDGAHVLITPTGEREWLARALQAPGQVRPSPGVPPCSEEERSEHTEQHFDPKLFEHEGRAYLAYVVEDVDTRLRFGPVPREGATPAEDRLTCDWLVDARSAQRSLVLAEVLADGSAAERLRVGLQQHGEGSVVVLHREESQLHVMTGSMSFVSYLVVELPAALRAGRR